MEYSNPVMRKEARSIDLFRELMESQRSIEERLERVEFTLRIKRRRSHHERPYENWMPDFIAALREKEAHIESAHRLCVSRNEVTPTLPTIYRRRRECQQFAEEWLEVVSEEESRLRENLGNLQKTLELMRTEEREGSDRVLGLIRNTKARLGMIVRIRETMAKEPTR